jgi:4-amino-4-deoxy-L-arabinose transferase-like glycosyltransferase
MGDWFCRSRFALPALLLLACLLFLGRLRTPLLEPEETRYAEIPRQMLHAGRWVVPVLHGQDYLDKPPLFYWLVMASYRAFGVHEWSARLVAGLIAVLTIAVVYGWANRVLGRRAALAAGLVLCLTPEFVYRGRMVTPNGLLALFTTAALACGHVGRLRLGDDARPLSRRRLLWLLAGGLTGLGLLTKGPVAAALVVPPLLIAGRLDRRLGRVGLLGWLAFFAAALAVAAPWYVAVSCRCPEFAGYFFWFHNVVRYAAPFDHAKPFWFYLPQLALGLSPWTLLLVPLVRRRNDLSGAVVFALAASAWGLLFFSLAGSKRPVYLVPVLPPLALAFGYLVHDERKARWLTVGGVTFVALWVWTHELLPVYAERFSLRRVIRMVEKTPPVIDRGLNIYCYPQPWDAVSFYLRRDDVRSFTAAGRDRLVAEVDRRPHAVLFVKTTHLKELLSVLPPGLEFEKTATDVGVTVGRVRPRREAAAAGYAQAGR